MELKKILVELYERQSELEMILNHFSTKDTKDYDQGRLNDLRHIIWTIENQLQKEEK